MHNSSRALPSTSSRPAAVQFQHQFQTVRFHDGRALLVLPNGRPGRKGAGSRPGICDFVEVAQSLTSAATADLSIVLIF